jgi:hypothetical protein
MMALLSWKTPAMSWTFQDFREFNWNQFHEQVVSETFDSLTEEEAIGLCGLLHTCRIFLSDEMRNVLDQVEGDLRASMPPLTLESACALVCDLYGHDGQELKTSVQQNWDSIRKTSTTLNLIERLESHRFVGHVKPYSELP